MQQQHPPVVGEDPTNLIVNYVPTPVTDAELRQLFEQYGELESARVIVDRHTHHPKGYGFVKFKHEASAREAIEKMNGFEILNKRLKVTPAKGPQNAQINKATQRMQALQASMAPPPQPVPQQMYQAASMAPVMGSGQQATYVLVDANGMPLQSFMPSQPFAPAGPAYVSAQSMPYAPPPPQMAAGGLPTFVPFRPLSPSKDPIYSESFNLTLTTTSPQGSRNASYDSKPQ